MDIKGHKPVTKKFNTRKVCARFKDNICAADLAEMESQSSKNKNVKCLLYVIDVFTKCPWVKSSKDKKSKTVLNVFLEIVNESNYKPNKYGLIKEESFIINLCKNGQTIMIFLMHSTYKEGKSVIAEMFIQTLKSKIYKKNTATDRKSYLSYLSKSADHYNNTYHHFINKKPINADYSAFTQKIMTNPKAPKLKVNDRVRITKYSNIFS